MNKLNTLEKLPNNLDKRKSHISEMHDNNNINKYSNIVNMANINTNITNNLKRGYQTNTKFLPKIDLTSKFQLPTKPKNDNFMSTFRTKYTYEKIKSIQILSVQNIISDNLNNSNINQKTENNNNINQIQDNPEIKNSKENDQNIFSEDKIENTIKSINLIKSIDSNLLNNSIKSSYNLNSNKLFLDSNNTVSNDENIHLNSYSMNNKNNNNNNNIRKNGRTKTLDVKKRKLNFELMTSNNKQKIKTQNRNNNHILIPDFHCTYNIPKKKLSFDEKCLTYKKSNSLVQRKFGFKKYSNFVISTPMKNTVFGSKFDTDNVCYYNTNKYNNCVSISDNNIEESIHSHFSNNYNLKISDSSNKQTSKSQKISSGNNSSGNQNQNFPIIVCNNDKILRNLDSIVGKLIKGKQFSWVVGDILYESRNSTIYKAFNINNGNIFVAKKFNCLEDTNCENFINEVQIYQNLDHPNIIKYIFSEQINNYYFLYLEYIPGGSLKNIIDKFGNINERLIRKYTKQILTGLKYLHDNKIIHRDIKCSNILLGDKGRIKLTDFGCSKKIALKFSKKDSSSNEEYCSSLKGTIPWCAPEIICHKKYGKKADIWSLGCTLIEMTGHQPWGKIDNIYQVMNKIGKTNTIPEIPENIGNKFKSFLDLCLKRDPKKRANLKTLLKHNFVVGFG